MLCVLAEISRLSNLTETDPKAFMIIVESHEVFGEGFKVK